MKLRFEVTGANRRLCLTVGALIVVLTSASGCESLTRTERLLRAQIVRIKGDARATLGAKTWRAARVGNYIRPGALIQTAKDSYLDLLISEKPERAPSTRFKWPGYRQSDQNALRIKSDSAVRIGTIQGRGIEKKPTANLRFDLQRGKLLGMFKDVASDSTCEVKFPTGNIRVAPDSVYELWVVGVVRVTEGNVAMSSTNAATIRQVPAGQQFDSRTGQLTPIPPPSFDMLY